MDENRLMMTDETESAAETVECAETQETAGIVGDNRGIGVVELILILVVLIGLVLIFKDRIAAIVNDAFNAISGDAATIMK